MEVEGQKNDDNNKTFSQIQEYLEVVLTVLAS